MAPWKVFVDGQEGTTGLKIRERLAGRAELEVLSIGEERRKDLAARKELINAADVVFLCLPDDAARESVSLVENPGVCILDASTAHRTDPAWTYGFPELAPGQRDKVRAAKRISVPGCHATGFAALVAPLVRAGVMQADYPVSCTSLTGHSGAGRKMIERYAEPANHDRFLGSRPYALTLAHKHLPEMQAHAGLAAAPLFMPVIGPYVQGMLVTIPVHPQLLAKRCGAKELHAVYTESYAGERFVRVVPFGSDEGQDEGFLDPQALNGTNTLEVFVLGNDERALAVARLDNLGKGASGAAVQCMNLALGLDEGAGLA